MSKFPSSALRNRPTAVVVVIAIAVVAGLASASSDSSSSPSSPVHRVKRIVGGQESQAPPPDDPVVFTRVYNRDARVEGFRNERTGVYSFLGLYYAEPPTGSNRYARPVYKRMAGDINATQHGPPCIQPDPQRPKTRVIGDENCLLLNIYTPQMPDETSGRPVYVWIHPGGFRYGSAAQYDATPMAQEGVIVVTPQYRLGSLGILGDGTKEFDGNLAMFDLATALRWVNEYIEHFGGDPKQVKAIGHGSGGASAMYLSMSKASRSAGEMNGVVAMSGTALSQYAMDKEPVQSVEEVARINGCPTTDELAIVQCMREKPAEEIIMNDSQVQTERLAGRHMTQGLAGQTGFQPHQEGADDERALPSLVVGEPEQQLRSGGFEPVPLLTGVTKDETANAVSLDTIQSAFGSVDEFLGSLVDVLKDLGGMLRLDAVTGDIAKPVLPGLSQALTPTLNEVLRVPAGLDVTGVLKKVVESTTDVLFNLPAVLSAQAWSQLAPAFVYSFEYSGTKSRGINFLRGLPIVAETKDPDPEVVAHGDELGYMFDVNDIFGNPLPETRLSDADDLKVRKNLIGMLVRFAESFKDGATSAAAAAAGDDLFRSVTGKGTPFIEVGTELKAGDDFRFCELSVFGAPLAALTKTTCEGLGSVLQPLGGVVGAVGGVTGILGGGSRERGGGAQPPRRGGLLGLGGLVRR